MHGQPFQIDDLRAEARQRVENFRLARAGQTAEDDDAARLEKAVTIARGRAELLVFTGGLGPTYDDMTKTAVCAALDTPLVLHQEVVEDMRRYFEKVFRREMPECDMQQAYLPEGCTVFTPRHPKTKPSVEETREYESALDVEGLCQRAMAGREMIRIKPTL